jgi:RNA polymerase sigma-B factor
VTFTASDPTAPNDADETSGSENRMTQRTDHVDEYDELAPLFTRFKDPTVAEDERARIREQLITGHAAVAEHIAKRFRNRGQRIEDLTQVGMVGLIGAVDRFDPARGSDFLSFAVPTITGEIRRYFRDATWHVHVPRRLKELSSQVNTAVTELSARLGRSPRPKEVAAELGIGVEDVYEGLQAGYAYHSDSLETPDADSGDSINLDRQFGQLDDQLTLVDDREVLAKALAVLPPREATIVLMRFGENLTQSQIAQRVGLSQMHVSRLLAASLAKMRQALDTPAEPFE